MTRDTAAVYTFTGLRIHGDRVLSSANCGHGGLVQVSKPMYTAAVFKQLKTHDKYRGTTVRYVQTMSCQQRFECEKLFPKRHFCLSLYESAYH